MYLSDVLTLPANIAGIPGISVLSGLVDGMPVGFEILAAPLHEETMLRVAYAYEQGHKQRPDLKAAPYRLRPAEPVPPETGAHEADGPGREGQYTTCGSGHYHWVGTEAVGQDG